MSGRRPVPPGRPFGLTPPGPDLRERDVARQLTGYLAARGWRCQRQHSGLVKYRDDRPPLRIGEPGMADWLCLRPLCEGLAEVFYLEIKRPSTHPSEAQSDWARRRRVERFEVVTAGSLEDFDRWYRRRFQQAA